MAIGLGGKEEQVRVLGVGGDGRRAVQLSSKFTVSD